MATSELEATLNRRKQRSEAGGAVFVADGKDSVADTQWDEHYSSQFTPRGQSRISDRNAALGVADRNSILGKPLDEESQGTVTPPDEETPAGKIKATDYPAETVKVQAAAEVLAAHAVAQDTCEQEASPPVTLDGDDQRRIETADAEGPPLLSEQLDITMREEPPLLSENLDVTMAAATVVQEDADEDEQPPTEPASPALSERHSTEISAHPVLPVIENMEFSWAPASMPQIDEPRNSLELPASQETNEGPEAPEIQSDAAAKLPVASEQVAAFSQVPANGLSPRLLSPRSLAEPASSTSRSVVDDFLSRSSNSYIPQARLAGDIMESQVSSSFQHQQPQQQTLQKPQHPPPQFSGQPFPQAQGTLRQTRLEEVAEEVSSLAAEVARFVDVPNNDTTAINSGTKRSVHPTELHRVLQLAEGIQARSRLTETDLEGAGWPRNALAQIRNLVQYLHHWQRSEEATKKLLATAQAGPRPSLSDVVTVIEQFLSSWRDLSTASADKVAGANNKRDPEQLRLRVDLGMQRRAGGATPMFSAALDQALALARMEPHKDLVAIRRLEALLAWQIELGTRSTAFELGALPLLSQALRELAECTHGLGTQELEDSGPARAGTMLNAPEVLWRAIVNGDVHNVEGIIRQGGLVSGRTQDPSGHSVLWNAVAFQRSEVALLLLRHFPPDAIHGVSLGELHRRNGNSLLHLVSGYQPFTQQAEGLFAMFFERMPEAMRMHRNVKGQSFVHIAAGRLNFGVLTYAASRGLASMFSVADCSGRTPRGLLEMHLAAKDVVNKLPQINLGASLMPPWCTYNAFQPPGAGTTPPFSDVTIELQNVAAQSEAQGAVHLHAHKVILAASSMVWHEVLRCQQAQAPNTRHILKLDPQICCHTDVAIFALRYLYTGDSECCSFRTDMEKVMQLLRLCVQYRLPLVLRAWAMNTIVRCLDESGDFRLVPTLLLEADSLGLTHEIRHYLARQLLCSDSAWEAAEDVADGTEEAPCSPLAARSRRAVVLDLALAELEPRFAA